MNDCANCKHSKAYHDGDGGRPCRAWDPDQTHPHMCACPGWSDTPAPKPAAVKTNEAGGADGQEF